VPTENHLNEFACDVRKGLRKPQKELHSKYLYDELGSSLFDAITHLPEYPLTRADERLLCAHAQDIARLVPSPAAVIELGSGMGHKTRYVLSALQPANPQLRFFPIDVSRDALARCQRDLSDIASVYPFEQSYLHGLSGAVAERQRDETLLILFLGSNIGNFERPCAAEFLREVRQNLQPGDAMLLGADLVKDPGRMLLAYDDPTGLTAAFNLNLLGRINRELGGNFNLRNFQHEARWNQPQSRIEMHLRSRLDQNVDIAHADLRVQFDAGETIWTESSHKFQIPELGYMATQTGFEIEAHWVDREWPFVESLWIAH
jgi:L-histidine N-alpha-methyltransferase